MARSSRSSSRSSPRAAPSRPAPVPAKTAAPVPATIPQQQQGPGMMAQMATTAGGVAMGSVMANGISSMLFGGRGGETAAAPVAEQSSFAPQQSGVSCDIQAKDFTSCLQATSSDMSACSFYLDQLKACQAAASPY